MHDIIIHSHVLVFASVAGYCRRGQTVRQDDYLFQLGFPSGVAQLGVNTLNGVIVKGVFLGVLRVSSGYFAVKMHTLEFPLGVTLRCQHP